MKLLKGTIRPGTVRAVLENGIIKASAPGLFSFTDNPEKMPPIMPWQIGGNSGSFTKVNVFDEVWIMNFSDNPRQLYWFRKDKIEENTNIPEINSEEHVEIICNKEIGGDWCTIYFSDGSGWVIGKGDSKIQITSDGSILLTNSMPNRDIEIAVDAIRLGTAGKSDKSAAYGEEVENALRSICVLLGDVATKALANPYTMQIGTSIMSKIGNITDKLSNISSPHVKID